MVFLWRWNASSLWAVFVAHHLQHLIFFFCCKKWKLPFCCLAVRIRLFVILLLLFHKTVKDVGVSRSVSWLWVGQTVCCLQVSNSSLCMDHTFPHTHKPDISSQSCFMWFCLFHYWHITCMQLNCVTLPSANQSNCALSSLLISAVNPVTASFEHTWGECHTEDILHVIGVESRNSTLIK
jgi:hypothetical protein